MTQHVLFEEDGAFKAGTVLSATDAALQIELVSGKRTKVKTNHVLLRFSAPAPAELMARATQIAADIDLDFLWECAPQNEFGFEELAREYHGASADAVQNASILMRLHSTPVYFHRKGRGRYRPAPPDILKAALAALERKKLQEERRAQMVQALKNGELPPAMAEQGVALLARPDKNSIEWKALEQAAHELQLSPLRLLLARGGIASAFRWHLESFLLSAFARGNKFEVGFDAALPRPSVSPSAESLPESAVQAFSIDDSATTEIDDAFSVQGLDSDTPTLKIGIHIAAPALAITRGDALDAVARARMSTVYAPGMKITMLPPEWIEAYSLNVGRSVAALSLYVEVDRASLAPLSFATRVERVRIAANLRHDVLDDVVTPEAIEAGRLDLDFGAELIFLHRFARALLAERERVRGKPEPMSRVDYSFVMAQEDEKRTSSAVPFDIEHGHVHIVPRRRGAPLDLIVAELMILANAHWGGWLAQHKVAGIYRSQTYHRGVSTVRMSTIPAPHEGMGVAQYTWASSPLRRFVDLVNQRQLIALARAETAPYDANDAELFAIISGFDAAYTAYADFQNRLERYWCLRVLRQAQRARVSATVVRGDVVRIDDMPLVIRVPGLPELPRGQRLELDVLGIDEVDLMLEVRLHQVLAAADGVSVQEENEDEGGIERMAEESMPKTEQMQPSSTDPDPRIGAASETGPTSETGVSA